jgi:hypothetical protein
MQTTKKNNVIKILTGVVFIFIAVALVSIHFLATDVSRLIDPLQLKVPGIGQGIVGVTPEIDARIKSDAEKAQAEVDKKAAEANMYRSWSQKTKWTAIGFSALMMVIAGLRGIFVTSEMASDQDKLIAALKADVSKGHVFAIIVAILSGVVAATSMVDSHVQAEQTKATQQATSMYEQLSEARQKLLDAKSAVEVEQVDAVFNKIRLPQ